MVAQKVYVCPGATPGIVVVRVREYHAVVLAEPLEELSRTNQ